jgi:type VII secretion integral membrane protein EccD
VTRNWIRAEPWQLRRGADNPPPPLYDDVVDAISDSEPPSFRPWTDETGRKFGHITASLALITAAIALLLGGSLSDNGVNLPPAITAGVVAIFAVAIGAVITRVYGAIDTGVVIASAGALPMAFVSGLYIVPNQPGRPSLLLAFVMVLVFATAAMLLLGAGVTVLIAAVTAASLGTLAMLFAVSIDHPVEGIAAATAAVALSALSALPRFTVALAKLPLPQVPGSAQDLKDDESFPDYAVIERRSGLAHSYMTGMMIGAGATAAVTGVIAAQAPTVFGPVLAALVAAVLMLRGRSYANGAQAVALLTCGAFALGGLLVGWLWVTDPFGRLLWVFGTLLVLGVAALVLGVAIPKQRFSPVARRGVDLFEALLIAAILPVALAVMNLYDTFRNLVS